MSRLTVACVLRSGGDYHPEHVAMLVSAVERYLPEAEIVCLADVPVPCKRVPLEFDWPGWWAKMELFRPDLGFDNLLYFDLDTVIVGPLADIASTDRLTLLRDFYRPDGLGSGVMMLPKAARDHAWKVWIFDPIGHARRAGYGGDQSFLETLWLAAAQRWQDVLPGQIVSYKEHVARDRTGPTVGRNNIPDGARVVAFHGRPRPWEIGWLPETRDDDQGTTPQEDQIVDH